MKSEKPATNHAPKAGRILSPAVCHKLLEVGALHLAARIGPPAAADVLRIYASGLASKPGPKR